MELLPGEVYPPYTAFWLAERAGISAAAGRQPIETTVPSRFFRKYTEAQNEWNRTLHQPRVDMRVVDAYVELMRSYRGIMRRDGLTPPPLPPSSDYLDDEPPEGEGSTDEETIKPVQVGDRTRYRSCRHRPRPDIGKRRQKTHTFDKKREAVAELARIRHEVNKGLFVGPSKLTTDTMCTDYLRSATRGKEVATVRNYHDAMRPVRERLGAVPLQKLTTAHIEDMVDWMLTAGRKRGGKPGTGLGPRSVQLTLSRLRAMLDDAVRRRLVPFNVAAPVKCPAQKRTAREPWTEVEVKTFLRSPAVREDRLRPIMILSLMGLRPAETCGLRWAEDIDLDADTLTVRHHPHDGGRRGGREGPEVRGREADTAAPEPVAAALRTLKATQAREQLAAGPDAYAASGRVLADELGQPCKTDWLRRATYRLMAAAEVRKVRPYDARHACLTYLAANGVPLHIVAAWAVTATAA